MLPVIKKRNNPYWTKVRSAADSSRSSYHTHIHKHFHSRGPSHLEVVNSGWPRLIGRGATLTSPSPMEKKREKGGKNSVIKLWVMSGSHGWHPPLSFSPSLPLFFPAAFMLFLPRFIHLSLHPSTPSSHSSFTPLLLCLLFPLTTTSSSSSLSDSFCLLSLSVSPRFHLFMPPPSNAFFCTSSPSHTYTNTHKHSQTYTQDSQWSLTPSMSRSVALCSCRHSCSPNTICWRKREGTQLSSTFTGSPKSSTVLLQKSDRRFLIRTNLHFAAL